MIIQEIEANALDLAGGELIRQKLDTHFATLIVLNVLDTMMLELSTTNKAFRSNKIDFNLEANTNTGTVITDTQQLDARFVRFRCGSGDSWRILDIVQTMDQLTRKENAGVGAILFIGTASPITYHLSFTPVAQLTAELWGSAAIADVANLNNTPPIPSEFGLVAAYRAAKFILNQLLLIDAKAFTPFVIAQKQALDVDSHRVENVWKIYRTEYSDSSSRLRSKAYNIHGVEDGSGWAGSIIGGVVNIIAKATALIFGSVRLSFPPVAADDPVAMGDNDPRVATLSSQYANSLATAVAAIGVAETMLVISENTNVAASVTVPSNIRLVFTQTGRITVSAGQTLTIGLMDDPGNKQVFQQADATANIRFLPGAVNKMNVAWFVGGTPTLCTEVIDQILASIVANDFGRLFLPEGIWTTNGSHILPSNTVIEGVGMGFDFFGTTLRSITPNKPMFLIGGNTDNIKFKNITLDGDNLVDVNGVLCEGENPDVSRNLAFEAVTLANFVTGFRIDSTDGVWQVAAILFDKDCIFFGNSHSGIRADTVNSALNCDANFFVPPGAWAAWLDGTGAATFRGCEFAGSGTYGVYQVERQSIVAAGGITTSGVAEAIVTAAGMLGSPRTVLVPLTVAEHTTANLIATAFRRALMDDPNVASFFHVVIDVNNDVTLMGIEYVANDPTMNISIQSGTTVGITNSPTSTNVQAGAASNLAAGVLHIAGGHPPVSFIGTQDEGFETSFENNASDLSQVVNYYGALVQSPVRLNQQTRINSFGSNFFPKAIRDGVGNSMVHSLGDPVNQFIFNNGVPYTVEQRLTNFTTVAGGSFVALETANSSTNPEIRSQIPSVSYQNDIFFGRPLTDALNQFLSTRPNQRIVRIGACNNVGAATSYYDLWQNALGRMQFEGNQPLPVRGYDFNADVRASRLSSVPIALSPTSPSTLDATLANVFTLTTTGNLTVNAVVTGTAGTPVRLIVLTSGVTSHTITFGTNFESQGVLNTGVVSGAYFVVEFISDGMNLVEAAPRVGATTASTTEVLTGTDTAKAVTPNALAALWEQGANIVSAATLVIGEGGHFIVTGSATITAIDITTPKAGRDFTLVFGSGITLTHNASTLNLPTGANIVTGNGDVGRFRAESGSNVRCVGYQLASGEPLIIAPGVTTPAGSVLQVASQSATDDVLRVQLAASQSGNAIEILPNGSSTPLSHFAANGSLNIADLGTNIPQITLGRILGDSGIHFITANGSGAGRLSTFGNDTRWTLVNSGGSWVFNAAGTSSGFQIHEQSVLAVGLNGTTRTWFNSMGANVASAAAIVPTGNLFHVTGTTTITSITSTGVTAGTQITIIFDSTAQMTNGGNLIIGSDFTGGANRSITLNFDGTNWYQAARSAN